MPNLAPVDLMILLIYFFFVISIGVGLKQFVVGGSDYLLAGRKLPGWLCGLAMAGAGAGSLEILAMGAAGARYGLVSASFFGLGAVIPLLFAAIVLVPVFSASRAKSVPGYLGLRFDARTQGLAAVISLIGILLSAAFTLYVTARVCASLRLFDAMFHLQRVNMQGQLGLSLAIPAAIVLVYVLLGGLGASMYAQVMQFFVLLLGFLPMVLLGLKQAGGWRGMKPAFTAAIAGHWSVPSGGSAMVAAILLGALLTAGVSCGDSTLMQNVLAAENGRSARRAAFISAAWKAVLPFLLVLPGVLAVAVPAQHTSITVRNENGEIFHEITVVPRAVEQGVGMVPAQTNSVADPMSGDVLKDAGGHTLIEYGMAIPALLPKNLPTGLLGLALAALLACLTGGLASRVTAFNTIFACDVYQLFVKKHATERHLLLASRWVTLGVIGVAAGLAWGALRVHTMPDVMDILAVLLAVFFVPMLATILLGALWKGATSYGAFSGLLAGFLFAVLHWGMTLPVGYARGFAGGWLTVTHHPASILSQMAGTAGMAIIVNALVTVSVSMLTKCGPDAEIGSLVYRSAPAKGQAWWTRPAGVAVLILVLSLVVSAIFAWS